MERRHRRIAAFLILAAAVSACQKEPIVLEASARILFSSCKNTTELAPIFVRYLRDNGYDALDRTASAQMTGQVPAHAVDILAVDARDDLLEIEGGIEDSGFGLRIRAYHRPDLQADAAFEAKFVGALTAAFDCTLVGIDRSTPRPAGADLYREFVRQQRHMMSRYR